MADEHESETESETRAFLFRRAPESDAIVVDDNVVSRTLSADSQPPLTAEQDGTSHAVAQSGAGVWSRLVQAAHAVTPGSRNRLLANNGQFTPLRADVDDDLQQQQGHDGEDNDALRVTETEELLGSPDGTVFSHDEALDEPSVQWWQRGPAALCSLAIVTLRFYLKHAWREMTKRKFNFCLGTFSVFLVVVVAATAQTMLSRAPVVFLQQGEDLNGQYDIEIRAPGALFYNYTTIERLGQQVGNGYLSYNTPRMAFGSLVYPRECNQALVKLGQYRHLSGWNLPERIDGVRPPRPGDSATSFPSPAFPAASASASASAASPSMSASAAAARRPRSHAPTLPSPSPSLSPSSPAFFSDTSSFSALWEAAMSGFNPDVLYVGAAANGVGPRAANNSSHGAPEFPYWDPVQFGCSNFSADCARRMCGREAALPSRVEVRLMDTAREARMELGRAWPFGVLDRHQAVISVDMANVLNATVGDVFLLSVENVNTYYTPLLDQLADLGLRRYNRAQPTNQTRLDVNLTRIVAANIDAFTGVVYVPVVIVGVIEEFKGKYSSEDNAFVVMEYGPFLETLLSALHPVLRQERDVTALWSGGYWVHTQLLDIEVANLTMTTLPKPIVEFMRESQQDLYTMTQAVLFNFPPNRINAYMTTNYDEIQNEVTNFGAKIAYAMGFPNVDMRMGLIDRLGVLKYFALYLGLILSVILTILFILSTMLIYSLLMISVETRQFEIGIQRMVGISRFRIVQMLLVQASSYAVPAWALGLIVAQVITTRLLTMLADTVEMSIDKSLTPLALRMASLLGLLIPLVSSIMPIRAALSANLLDTLDTRHSKTQAVTFSIERSETSNVDVAWMAFGVFISAFGFLIYYLLPLSLLSFNLALFFDIFFGLLLGMLFGLILLSLNIEHLIERTVVLLFFWWERRFVMKLIVKNLEAHRLRNRKTTVMYALTIGFIIFITVAYNTEIQSVAQDQLKTNGGWMAVKAKATWNPMPVAGVAQFEELLAHQPTVLDWGWRSAYLAYADDTYDDTYMSNTGHVYQHSAILTAVSPSYLEITFQDYLVPALDDPTTALSLSEQLYTVRGSTGGLLGSMFMKWMGIHDLATPMLFLGQRRVRSAGGGDGVLDISRFRPLAFLDSAPGDLAVTQFTTNRAQSLVVSFHTLVRWSRGKYNTVSQVPMSRLVLKLKDNASKQELDTLKSQLKRVVDYYGLDLWDFRDFSFNLVKTNFVMDLIFGVATNIAMFLCLFSLMASMYTNILEQAKEIAILRAMGMTRFQVVRVYVYEAFTLTVAASLTGTAIGATMGWTMVAQRALFTQMPIPFVFPWNLLAMVLVAAAVCGFLASLFPARQLNQKSIASIFRTLL